MTDGSVTTEYTCVSSNAAMEVSSLSVFVGGVGTFGDV